MLKIGEFSKLSMLTVKTLRYYEKVGLLIPKSTDKFSGYRLYETNQLQIAAKIKALRQLDFTVDEVRVFLIKGTSGATLESKIKELETEKRKLSENLSILHYLLEEKNMNYQAVIKEIPECIVYSEQRVLKDYSEVTSLVLDSAKECLKLNPGLECLKPDYCFCEYLDGEYKENDVSTRYSQAVVKVGIENDRIKFRKLPLTKVISIYHKGSYDLLGDAYAYIMKYAKDNGYEISGLARESYIDGAWNKDSSEDWLTEIQLPIK